MAHDSSQLACLASLYSFVTLLLTKPAGPATVLAVPLIIRNVTRKGSTGIEHLLFRELTNLLSWCCAGIISPSYVISVFCGA